MKKLLLLFFVIQSLFALNDSDLLIFRESISDYYYRFLDSSTSFLYDKNSSNFEYIKRHNKLKIYIDNSIDDNGKIKSSLSIRAHIRLPKINNNLYLTVDKDSTNISDNDKISELQEEKQKSRIGLKYYIVKEKKQNLYLKLGGRLNFKGSKIYLKLGSDKANNFEGINTFVYFNEYFYIQDRYFQTEVGFDFRTKLSSTHNISQLNNITLDEDSKTYIANTILLDQYINTKTSLSYWTTLYSIFDDKEFKKDSISFNIKYHYFINKWIFIDLIPSLVKSYQHEEDNKGYLYLNFGFIF